MALSPQWAGSCGAGYTWELLPKLIPGRRWGMLCAALGAGGWSAMSLWTGLTQGVGQTPPGALATTEPHSSDSFAQHYMQGSLEARYRLCPWSGTGKGGTRWLLVDSVGQQTGGVGEGPLSWAVPGWVTFPCRAVSSLLEKGSLSPSEGQSSPCALPTSLIFRWPCCVVGSLRQMRSLMDDWGCRPQPPMFSSPYSAPKAL